MVGGITGPITVPGLTTTTSKPFSLENSQAAFSAKVLDAGYQTYGSNKNPNLLLATKKK
jgi:hypothetical protein